MTIEFEVASLQAVKTRGEGLNLVYNHHTTPFGSCTTVCVDDRICVLDFYDDHCDEQLSRLKKKFTGATLSYDALSCIEIIKKIFNREGDFKVKLLLWGTDFQVKVWQALAKIPIGDTITYKDIANSIGVPMACRAVGSAIGKNNIAWLIPCHRVIRADGALGGFRWGIERKKAFIAHEKSGLQPNSLLTI